MTARTWNHLGPREKQLLAILRRADEPLPSRAVLLALGRQGDDVAYTTVSTILGRLVEKGVVAREEEIHAGSPRFLHSFDAADHRGAFVDEVVDDVARVFGTPGLELLVQRARADRDVPDLERTLTD